MNICANCENYKVCHDGEDYSTDCDGGFVLRSDIAELQRRVTKFEERLRISPYGDDRIDELEQSMQFKDFELSNTKDRLQKAIAAIELHKVDTMYYRGFGDFSDAEDKLWKILEELR